jgi:hypothetical protein
MASNAVFPSTIRQPEPVQVLGQEDQVERSKRRRKLILKS